jgi:predicted phage tail protein
LSVPENFKLENNKITWDSVEYATRYEIIQENDASEQSVIIRDTNISLDNLYPGIYKFKVRAVGDGYFYLNSPYTTSIEIEIKEQKLDTPTNITISEGILSFSSVENARSYLIKIDFSEFTISTTSFNINTFNLLPGIYEITVQAIGNGFSITNSDFSETLLYEIKKEKTPLDIEIIDFRDHVLVPMIRIRILKD